MYASGKCSGEFAYSAGSHDHLMLSIAIKIQISLCWHYFMNFLYHVDLHIEFKYYEGCSNMNASSFITFFTYMLRQNAIPFWKELFLAFQMAPNIKKHTQFFSSYRPLYKGRSSILNIFWIKLQHTCWYLCGYSVISLLIWDKMTPNFSCKAK